MFLNLWQAHGWLVTAVVPADLHVLFEHQNVLQRSTSRTSDDKVGMFQTGKPTCDSRTTKAAVETVEKEKITDLCLGSCLVGKTVTEYKA